MPSNVNQVVNKILEEIQNLPSMSKLAPEKYAETGGYADEFVKGSSDLKSNQLRKIFHYIKGLKREFDTMGFDRRKVSLVIPRLAYASGRNLIPYDFYKLMNLCFEKKRCNTKEDFDTAVNFLEAIVAYHKYHENHDRHDRS